MIVPVMAILNLVLTRQIYSEETNGAHAHYSEPGPLKKLWGSYSLLPLDLFCLIIIHTSPMEGIFP